MGLGDEIENIEDAVDGQTAAEQVAEDQTGSDAKWDTVVDSVADQFASDEGAPAALDPELNNVVNDEVNKL